MGRRKRGRWPDPGKAVRYLSPARDGAVLPIMQLNGYKIAGPTALGRAPDEEVSSLLEANGYVPHFVEGSEPAQVHQALAGALDECHEAIRSIQARARETGGAGPWRWPAIVLRTPKGWTGPREVDGLPMEGTFRAHQVPLTRVREDEGQLKMLEQWMRSYQPETLFSREGHFVEDLAALAPRGRRRMGSNPLNSRRRPCAR